jgi:Na+-transporting methylmalonyl-CoA/oxaloacetate decarboxylase gamma subunit
MASSLGTVLLITVVGMTLLFLALALFYGLLSLMMATIKDRPAETKGQSVRGEVERNREEEAALRAAAIAVALARAEMEQEAGYAPAGGLGGPQVSPWWILYHQRQMRRQEMGRRRAHDASAQNR